MTPATEGATEFEASLRTVAGAGVRHEISEILREAIWNGVLRPGQRLTEQWLSTEMRVSRPPLREAIRVLEQEGLVVSVPRRGAFVRRLTGQDIFEIYVLRCALEGMAAELLTQQASAEALDELERMIDRVEARAGDDLRARIDEDLRFHRALVRMSGNQRLASTWEQLAGQLRLALTLVDPAFFEADYVELTHRPLIEAIRRRNAREAWRLTRLLLDVGRSLKERWQEQDGGRGGGDPARLPPPDTQESEEVP